MEETRTNEQLALACQAGDKQAIAQLWEQTKAFIEHIRTCPDCQDELEINYIVMIGLQQLDEGEILSVDFRKKLKEDIDRRYEEARKEEERNHSVRVMVIAFLLSLFLWLLGKGIACIM